MYLAYGLAYNKFLKTLNASENNFGDDGISFFSKEMMENQGLRLQHLDLSENYISDTEAVKMAESLTENNTLESFSLQGNTLTAQSGQAFIVLMRTNKKLSKLDLTKNLIPLRQINEINKKCDENNDKTDDKLMPRLLKEYDRQLANQRQPEDF
jgi:hypothetical protein